MLSFFAIFLAVLQAQPARQVHYQTTWNLERRSLISPASELRINVPQGFGASRSILSWHIADAQSFVAVGIATPNTSPGVVPLPVVRPIDSGFLYTSSSVIRIDGTLSVQRRLILHLQVRRGTMLRLYESGSALMSFVAETDGVLEDGVMQPLEQATETHAVALLMSARRPERVDAPKQTPDGTYQVNAATLMRHANSRIRPRALPGSPRFELVRIEVDERGGVRRVSCVQKQCEFLPLLEEEIRAITFRPFEVQGIAVSVRAELPIGVGPEGTMLTPLAAN